MCEYQKYDLEDPLPICTYTQELCTLCILGNMGTYNEVRKAEKESESNAWDYIPRKATW